jgi:hypothetical protein
MKTADGCQKTDLPDFVSSKEKIVMATNECWPKGGLGIIMSPNDANLYTVTGSRSNEIEWGYGESSRSWIGQSSSTPEVAVFYEGKVWPPQFLPHDFDKSKSVIVSFEKKEIRFYDFVHKSGGYYERLSEN